MENIIKNPINLICLNEKNCFTAPTILPDFPLSEDSKFLATFATLFETFLIFSERLSIP